MSLLLSANREELRERFHSLSGPRDIAALLDIEYSRLVYHIYKVPRTARYTTFPISKKSGGIRTISTPSTALKIIQRKLNQVLEAVYEPKAPVYGFTFGKNIVTNARLHSRKIYVLNIDLKDFFPSINFGRVRGMFIAVPYSLPPEVATVLAQICCIDNQLPQGAPTSPVVSNMICAKMDTQLRILANKHRCTYSRYADDLTFSTSMQPFPSALAQLSDIAPHLKVGNDLKRIIQDNGFKINTNKMRLQKKGSHQEVTGLTTNKFPNVRRAYVRKIRGMLHAWEKFGHDAAEEVYLGQSNKHRNPNRKPPIFKRVVKGKIDFLGMVRGKDNEIYVRLTERLAKLAPEFAHLVAVGGVAAVTKPLIITEGKTDWKHLKAAFRKFKLLDQFKDLDLEFHEYEHDMGDKKLLKMCESYANVPQPRITIFVFDRDNPDTTPKVCPADMAFKKWSDTVFSFAIPVPEHRNSSDVCIELYYKDADIMRKDENGRRLYISTEFHQSGRHRTEDLNTDLYKVKGSKLSILADNVYDANNSNVALPKDDFAEHVLKEMDYFNDMDFSEFRKIFEVIAMIAKQSQKHETTTQN